MLIDGKALGEHLTVIVRDFVARATAAFGPRLDALEKQIKELPAPEPGKPGKDADPTVIAEMVKTAVDAIPKPKDGDPGKSFTAEEVQALVDEAVEKAVASLPPAAPGKDADSAVIKTMVDEAVAALPKPADGKSVSTEEVRDLVADLFTAAMPEWVARVDKAIADLPIPADGKGVTVDDFRQLFEAEQAKWALDFERRAQDVLTRAVEKIPAPKDGKDALELEDLSGEHDGDGNVTLRLARGDVVKEFTLRLPRFKVKGGYREGVEYREGDGVSFGGSFYVAQKDAPLGKPGESDDWWLAAKKGRDGKDLTPVEAKVHQVVRTQ